MSARPRVSLCLIARDEATTLARCLVSAAPAVDEVIVVDTGSRDATAAIARRHGARVVSTRWRDDFAAARNLALEHARGDWVLSLDADETLPATTAGALRDVLAATDAPALRLPIHNLDARGTVDAIHCAVRAFRRRPEHRWTGAIHEQPTVGRAADGDQPILHHGYADPDALRRKLLRNLALLERRASADLAARFYRAETRLALGDASEAIAEAQSALAGVERPGPVVLLLLDVLAAAQAAAGQTEAAMETCRAALALRPEWIDPRLLLGLCAVHRGQQREALVQLGRYLVDRERLAQDPTWPSRLPRLRTLGGEARARTALARVHASLGDRARAQREGLRAAALAPASPEPAQLLRALAEFPA